MEGGNVAGVGSVVSAPGCVAAAVGVCTSAGGFGRWLLFLFFFIGPAHAGHRGLFGVIRKSHQQLPSICR